MQPPPIGAALLVVGQQQPRQQLSPVQIRPPASPPRRKKRKASDDATSTTSSSSRHAGSQDSVLRRLCIEDEPDLHGCKIPLRPSGSRSFSLGQADLMMRVRKCATATASTTGALAAHLFDDSPLETTCSAATPSAFKSRVATAEQQRQPEEATRPAIQVDLHPPAASVTAATALLDATPQPKLLVAFEELPDECAADSVHRHHPKYLKMWWYTRGVVSSSPSSSRSRSSPPEDVVRLEVNVLAALLDLPVIAGGDATTTSSSSASSASASQNDNTAEQPKDSAQNSDEQKHWTPAASAALERRFRELVTCE